MSGNVHYVFDAHQFAMEGDKLMLKILKGWPEQPPEASDIIGHFGDNRVITGLSGDDIEARLKERRVSGHQILAIKNLDNNDANLVICAHVALQHVKDWGKPQHMPAPAAASSSSSTGPHKKAEKRPRSTDQDDQQLQDDEVGVVFTFMSVASIIMHYWHVATLGCV